MAVNIKAPRGTQDILPANIAKWQYIEKICMEISALYGFKEIRTPMFEQTDLFARSVGNTTDIVQKEMYTFMDKGDRSMTLKPEATAGVIRSVIENGLLNESMPLKLSYLGSCFRYEKPQAGRYREFHQFGAELIGSNSYTADAQMIAMVQHILSALGLDEVCLNINSIGCKTCREEYYKILRDHFVKNKSCLCETCHERLEKNPMRILDCKSHICKEIAKDAPIMLDYLCEECSNHFEGLKEYLSDLNIKYTVNSKIVRGLDYYCKTVFEFISEKIGSQGTVCGGGRYDGLSEMLGGTKAPAIGFAIGLERISLIIDDNNVPKKNQCYIYIGSMGKEAHKLSVNLVQNLRIKGVYAECDDIGRSVKSQMKYADKLGAKYSCIIGENEISEGSVTIKNMNNGESFNVVLDSFTDILTEV